MTSSLSQQARDLLAKQYRQERDMRSPKLTPSITFGNASPGRPTYTGNNMGSARSDADQHFQYAGAGFQAQIERV